jgi:hypothetical protein
MNDLAAPISCEARFGMFPRFTSSLVFTPWVDPENSAM